MKWKLCRWKGGVLQHERLSETNLYDFLVIDVLLAPFDKFHKRAGVSAFEKSAVWFHCKGSLRGMVIGIVFAPIVGLIGYPFQYKIFTELGHGGLAGEHPEQFLEEMIKAHES